MTTPAEMRSVRLGAMRWTILQAISYGGHLGASDEMILPALRLRWLDASLGELRNELDYLDRRCLVAIQRNEVRPWRCTLTRTGRDLVDYTIDCEPGIDRPLAYWRDGA